MQTRNYSSRNVKNNKEKVILSLPDWRTTEKRIMLGTAYSGKVDTVMLQR